MIKVSLRRKSISKNRQSLYLDFYPAIVHPETKELTRREFLKMYIFDNPTAIQKKKNKETEHIAERIQHERENRLNKPEIYSQFEKDEIKSTEMGKKDFIAFFDSIAAKKKGANLSNWNTTSKYLKAFIKNKKHLAFEELNEEFCNNFKDFLMNSSGLKSTKQTIAQNTAASYFTKFLFTLKEAYNYGYLRTNLGQKVKRIKELETQREFLSIEELNKLIEIPCNSLLLKRAAIFSSLTGLRFSDIQKLIWNEVQTSEDEGFFIRFQQKKTKGMETLPISHQAAKLMGDRKNPEEQVFNGLKYSAYENKHLAQWIGAAGITRKITFHCFRHTYATLQLSSGTDIYTVSKMLGHRDIKTTQVYANIVDEKKHEATTKITLNF